MLSLPYKLLTHPTVEWGFLRNWPITRTGCRNLNEEPQMWPAQVNSRVREMWQELRFSYPRNPNLRPTPLTNFTHITGREDTRSVSDGTSTCNARRYNQYSTKKKSRRIDTTQASTPLDQQPVKHDADCRRAKRGSREQPALWFRMWARHSPWTWGSAWFSIVMSSSPSHWGCRSWMSEFDRRASLLTILLLLSTSMAFVFLQLGFLKSLFRWRWGCKSSIVEFHVHNRRPLWTLMKYRALGKALGVKPQSGESSILLQDVLPYVYPRSGKN